MFWKKRLDSEMTRLHEQSDDPKHLTDEEKPELEKNDMLAMMLSAVAVILPVAIGVLVVVALAGYFFLFH